MDFARYSRHLFYTPGDSFCSTEIAFTNIIVKRPPKKENKNWTLLVRKTTTYAEIIKINESWYIALFLVSGSIVNLTLISVNIRIYVKK